MVISKFRYCPYCGHRLTKSNYTDINFCYFCGKRLNKQNPSLSKKLSCTICHESLDLGIKNLIKCSYCGSQFHRNCISSWLLDYNSCPLCLNVFLMPRKIAIDNKKL